MEMTPYWQSEQASFCTKTIYINTIRLHCVRCAMQNLFDLIADVMKISRQCRTAVNIQVSDSKTASKFMSPEMGIGIQVARSIVCSHLARIFSNDLAVQRNG